MTFCRFFFSVCLTQTEYGDKIVHFWHLFQKIKLIFLNILEIFQDFSCHFDNYDLQIMKIKPPRKFEYYIRLINIFLTESSGACKFSGSPFD